MENLLASVQAARQAYGPTMTDDECARLCNAVAWQHRATGWGLSRKTSGTRGRLPNGVEVAHDILHHQATNTLVDILTAAGAASTPTWNPVGPPQSPDRAFVAPFDPASWSGPTPTPTPDALTAVLEELVALRAELAAVRDEARLAAGAAVRLEQRVAAGLPLRVRAGLLGTVTGTVGGA